MRASPLNPQTHFLDPQLACVSATLEDWTREDKTARLWSGDAALWTGSDEARWLGWLRLTEEPGRNSHLERLVREVRQEKFTRLLLLGMGGSSLFPEVLAATFGKQPGYPELHVLDSTDPGQILRFESRIDLSRTLFIVSSKSGSTLEPNILKQYFFERVRQSLGESEAGSRFVAITDPGSRLQETAEREGFRSIFFGEPAVGGRYSALSNFGRVPAALMGLDVAEFIHRARSMVEACKPPGLRGQESRSGAGGHSGHAGQGRQGQAHTDFLPGNFGHGRLAGAVAGRVDRQGWKGPRSRRR